MGALGGLLFGFDTAVISGATAGLTRAFGLVNLHPLVPIIHQSMTVSELGVTVSIALWGTVIGALTAGSLGQRYGSREMLRLTAVLYIVSSIGCAFAPTWGVTSRRALSGWTWNRRVFRLGSGLYRRTCSATFARKTSWNVSDQHRSRNSAGLPIQLPHRTDEPRCD